jgi:FkbM family methyltransferase
MAYYGQHYEDAELNNRYFKNKRNGTYVEIGALDGVLLSNTKFFEESLGWSGILVEPHPYKFEELKKNRPNNFLFSDLVSNLENEVCFRIFCGWAEAVSCVMKEGLTPPSHITGYFDNPGYSNIKQESIMMIPRTFADIVKSTGISHIDFASIDCEGHEREVLLSYFDEFPLEINKNPKIDVIMIECLNQQLEREECCRRILLNNGYKLDTVIGLNEYYSLGGVFI